MSDLGMDWNELTEDELRDELSIRGLDTSGTKTDLVEKLQTDDAENTAQQEAGSTNGGEAEGEHGDEHNEFEDAEEECEHEEAVEDEGGAGDCAMEDEGNEQGSEHLEEEEEAGEGDNEFDHSAEQVEDIVGEIDDMGEFIEPAEGEKKEEDPDEEKTEENGTDEHKDADEADEDAKKKSRPETQLPDKRELRKDLLVDYRFKSVCMFPIGPADLTNPTVKEYFAKCLDFGTKFYNITDDDGNSSVQGYVEFHFERYSDAVDSIVKLKELKEGINVRHQKPFETHEEFVSEVEKGKQIPLKTSQTQGTLLVSGLPKEVTEDDLKSIFTEAVGIFIARDDSRKPKGYAYIDYGEREKAKQALKDFADVKMGEQQLVLTDYHKRLVEGIPMEEYAQGDPVTGLLSQTQRDIMVARLHDLRQECYRCSKKYSPERVEMLERRIMNLRQRLSRDSRLSHHLKSKSDRYHIDRRPRSRPATDDSRSYSRDRHHSPPRHRSPSFDYKRRRQSSWGSSSYDQHGDWNSDPQQQQTMDLLMNLTQVLNTQLGQQQVAAALPAPAAVDTVPRERYRTNSYTRGTSGSSYSSSYSRGSGGYSYTRGGGSSGASYYRGSGGSSSTYSRGSSSYPRGSSGSSYSRGGGSSSYSRGGSGSSYSRGGSGSSYSRGGGSSYSRGGGSGSSSYSRGTGGYSYTRGGGSNYSRGGSSSSYPQEGSYSQGSSYSRGYSSGASAFEGDDHYARDDRYTGQYLLALPF
ncbi:hypothetical protein NP493_1400g00041 [Ridgeia piscesae]|uniref:Uncharacterized protein n=1 Tax=Ridgeia piscesae TaxID=27915 RepID=A0AAD9K6A2_RIDPI|nr:hypothetical protein NP493_1400g00041 [Ridgeia piscesae]